MVVERLKSNERDSTMQASTERDFFRSLRSMLVVESWSDRETKKKKEKEEKEEEDDCGGKVI